MGRHRLVLDEAADWMLLDTSVAGSSFCDRNGRVWLNDFWFSTSLDAALMRKQVLLEHWSRCAFKHPGELEGAWYNFKSALSSHQLSPRQAMVVNHEFNPVVSLATIDCVVLLVGCSCI